MMGWRMDCAAAKRGLTGRGWWGSLKVLPKATVVVEDDGHFFMHLLQKSIDMLEFEWFPIANNAKGAPNGVLLSCFDAGGLCWKE